MVSLNILVKPLWVFFIDRKVQNTLGNETYGLYAALLNLTIVFNILLDVGITNYNNRNIAINKITVAEALYNMLFVKIGLVFAYYVVILSAAYVLGYRGSQIVLLLLIACTQFLNSVILFCRSTVSGNQHFKMDSILSVSDKLLMFLFCGYFLYISTNTGFTIQYFLYIQIICYIAVISIAMWYIQKNFSLFTVKKINKYYIKELIIESIPYALLILIMAIYMRSDGILIERLLPLNGAIENGKYMYGFRILDMLNSLAILFAAVLLPMFSKLISEKLPVHDLIQTSVHILLPISFVIVAFVISYSNDCTFVLYHQKNFMVDLRFLITIASFPAFCIVYIYSTLLTANGNLKLLIYISIIACIISIGFNLYLIPKYLSEGASITLCITEWFVAISTLVFCIKIFKLQIRWKWILSYGILFIGFVAINYILKYSVDASITVAIASNMVLFIPFVILLKIWNVPLFKQYFS